MKYLLFRFTGQKPCHRDGLYLSVNFELKNAYVTDICIHKAHQDRFEVKTFCVSQLHTFNGKLIENKDFSFDLDERFGNFFL